MIFLYSLNFIVSFHLNSYTVTANLITINYLFTHTTYLDDTWSWSTCKIIIATKVCMYKINLFSTEEHVHCKSHMKLSWYSFSWHTPGLKSSLKIICFSIFIYCKLSNKGIKLKAEGHPFIETLQTQRKIFLQYMKITLKKKT